ncbi:MAG: hypothetical protein QM692_09665 [Thermomicrobiales bacterium]
MDADQFDALAGRLTSLLTRRRSLATFGAIGLATAALAEEAESKRKKKKRKKRRKQNTPTTPAPTCSDGIRNGTETDIDCGGSCPRCPNGKTCQGTRDCETGLCAGGSCAVCNVDEDCAAMDPDCECDAAIGKCFNAGDGVAKVIEGTCADCPAGTLRCYYDGFRFAYCLPRCGERFPE